MSWMKSLVVVLALAASLDPPAPPGRLVDIGGWKLHLNCTGTRHGTDPLVVFESGAGGTSYDWYFVQRDLSASTRACSYDRAGTAWSDVGPHPRTIHQMEYELHKLLEVAGEKPPYILVGHSFGGIMVRVFQHEHPQDVAGMVLVDAASDDTRLVHFKKLVRMRELDSGRPIPPVKTAMTEEDRQTAAAPAPVAVAPPGPGPAAAAVPAPRSSRPWPADVAALRAWASQRREAGTLPGDGDYTGQEFAELYAARQAVDHVLGDLPLIVLIARLRVEPTSLPSEWFVSNAEINRQDEELASMSSIGKFLYAEHSTHVIAIDEPDVVASAITAVLKTARARPPRRLVGPSTANLESVLAMPVATGR